MLVIIAIATGKGIPNELALSNKQTGIVPFAAIPTVEEAVTDFETQGAP